MQPTIFHSPVRPSTSNPEPILTIQPRTPDFYINILEYADASRCFAEESAISPDLPDQTSRRLHVSDSALLQQLLDSAGPSLTADNRASQKKDLGASVTDAVITWLRSSSTPSFLDAFVYSHEPRSMHKTYRRAVLHHYVARKFAFRHHRLYVWYGILARVMFVLVVLRFL
jgi:hypothetical protein